MDIFLYDYPITFSTPTFGIRMLIDLVEKVIIPSFSHPLANYSDHLGQ